MFRIGRFLCNRPVEVTRVTANLPHFDVCIIGAGPAGIAAALRAVDYNKRVCIVEANRIGGADLWNGTLQSKTLWEMAKYVSRLSGQASRRVFDEDVAKLLQNKISDERVRKTLEEVSVTREKQLLHALNSSGVTLLHGKGIFASPYELDVHSTGTGSYYVLTADYFVIATGSVPRKKAHFLPDNRYVVTTDTIMQMPIPSSLVIIGAGAAGCEFASIYANLGRTKISLVDEAPRILPMEDEDIALFVEEQLKRRGVTIHNACTLFDLESWEESETKGGCVYSVRRNNNVNNNSNNASGGGAVETYMADRALVSVGRVPNVAGLGLGNTSCKVSDGRIVVDPFNRCLPHTHIYAIGDASVDRALVNMAQAQGRGAIDHMYSEKIPGPVSFAALTNLSTVLFLEEEVACVGLNEQQCRAQSLGYMVARYGYEYMGRALAMGETCGFCKVIVTNDREKRLLGVRAVGAHAGSIVEVASLAIRRVESAYELLKLTASYPSVVQGFVECIRMILGRASVKPNITPAVTLSVWHPPHFKRGREYIEEVGEAEAQEPQLVGQHMQETLHRAQVQELFVKDVLRKRTGAVIHSSNNSSNSSGDNKDSPPAS